MKTRGISGITVLFFILLFAAVCAASPITDPPESRESKPKVVEEPLDSAIPKMKVTFDPTARGIVIVESAGERLRIDTSNNTVERISRTEEAKVQNPPQEPS